MSVDRLQAASFCGSERERVQSAEGGWGSGAGNRSPRQPSFQGVKSKMAGETLLVALGATRKEQNSAVFLGLAPCLRGGPGGGEFTTITLKNRGRGFQNHFVIANKISKIYGTHWYFSTFFFCMSSQTLQISL